MPTNASILMIFKRFLFDQYAILRVFIGKFLKKNDHSRIFLAYSNAQIILKNKLFLNQDKVKKRRKNK